MILTYFIFFQSFIILFFQFYFYNYSMKAQKSSVSLYNTPEHILKQFSSNKNLYKFRSSIFKPKPLQSKKFNYMNNTKNHLKKLIQLSNQLETECKASQESNKDIRLSINFIREEYLQRNIREVRKEGSNMIRQLKKKVTIKHGSDKLRYESLQDIVSGLHKDNRQLANKIDQIGHRISHLQNVMGNDPTFY